VKNRGKIVVRLAREHEGPRRFFNVDGRDGCRCGSPRAVLGRELEVDGSSEVVRLLAVNRNAAVDGPG